MELWTMSVPIISGAAARARRADVHTRHPAALATASYQTFCGT